MKNKIKSIVKVGFVASMLVGASLLTGCGPQDPLTAPGVQDAIIQAEQAGYDNAVAKVTEKFQADLDAYNLKTQTQLDEEKARDALVLADMEAEIAKLKAEQDVQIVVPTEAELVLNNAGYMIDEVNLGAVMSENIFHEDYAKLKSFEIEYEDEKYDVEESLILQGFNTKLNFDDFGADIVVAVEDGAIEYKVEFDSPVPVVEDEELKLSFMGKELRVIEYDSGSITYRLAEKFSGDYTGITYTVDEMALKVVDVYSNNDGEAQTILVDVDGVQEAIELGKSEEVNGLKLYFEDAFKTASTKYVKFYAGEEVEETVADGDDYDSDDRFSWTIDGNVDGLLSVGLTLQEALLDEDEVLQLGDSISLPGEYLSVQFTEAKNLEVKDVDLKVSNTRLTLDFDGKIEVDSRKVDSRLTFKDNGFEYEYKGEKEFSTDLTLISLFNGDRELSVEQTADNFTVGPYTFEYIEGDDPSFLSGPSEIDEDNDYRETNGDILYASEVNKDEQVRSVKVGLVSDKDTELIFKVE